MKSYEMHMHTKYSKCSNLELQTILKIAKKRGLSGVAITDHDTFVGAQKLLQLNMDKNFEVILGEELSTKHGHILVYFLQKEIKSRNFLEIVDEAREQDALIMVAHPFDFLREYSSKEFILQNKKYLDGIEILNARSIVPWSNWQARIFALRHNLGISGGSDAHFSIEIGRVQTCVKDDLRKALKKKQVVIKGNTLYGPVGNFLTVSKKFRDRDFTSISKFLFHKK